MSDRKSTDILFVAPFNHDHGTERITFEVIRSVLAEMRVCLLYAGGRGALFSTLKKLLGQDSVFSLGSQDRRANMARNAFQVARRIVRLRPQVVFAVNPGMGMSVGLARLWLGSGWKSTFILAHHVFPSYRSDPIEVRRMKKYFSMFDLHVVVSPSMEEDVRIYAGTQANIACIPNGIDLDEIRRQVSEGAELPQPCPPHRWRCLYVGGLRQDKRVDRLLHAFARLPEKDQTLLLLVGDGDARKSLEELARRLGIAHRCLFLGHWERPFRWAKGCDLFVQTPDWETFGLSVLEAMAAGLPVLSTGDNSPGLRNVLQDGVNGRLIESGDIEEFAKCWSKLLHDEKARRRFVRAGIQTAHRFSIETMRFRYLSLLRSCIA